jgi:uncharacterized protein
MENIYENCIQTYSGILVDIKTPNPNTILVCDIAKHLSQLCRYTGASRSFYSVAEHSVLVANLCPQDLKLIGLLHDSAEGFLGDCSTILKNLLPEYQKLEKTMNEAIIKRFDLGIPDFNCVKIYDRIALDIESKVLMGPRHPVWDNYKVESPEGYDFDYSLLEIKSLNPEEAERAYLDLFNSLWLKR